MKNQSIRELQKMKDQLLEEYNANVRAIDEQINAIRKARGTKLVEPDYSGWHQPGRDQDLLPHGYHR